MRFPFLALMVVALATSARVASGAAAAKAVPQTLPGWRMELIAEAPKVNHPSVVCTAPDGRVFVAEDPMDIRTAHADVTEGRILCLHPDGRTTVFAEQLYAVFGMQYLEGKLYVLHNPKFSVFKDDGGVGRDRVDLIEQTNPKPWALDWNDHVPANFRLGMDGYFYVAVGDKGLFGAVGRDGSKVTMRGGGIVRMRPDGTRLEIFARGVRNIMDVALNAEDELFTYDNTDEHDWMGRLTHMVDRGFYGYPHDFIPRRPYTLWMMHDFGGGAATGIECYNGDALPPEYRGNLFLGDFGKRQVLRVITERQGATYRVVRHQEMFPNPPEDFRPVGIAWSADERGLYVCDWAHRDTKEDVKVGRLWRVSWTGDSPAKAKPGWYLPLALGVTTNVVSATDLIAGLSHPSRAVRLTAERAIVRQFAPPPLQSKIIPELKRLVGDATAPTQARLHAIWTLSFLNNNQSGVHEILAATKDSNTVVVAQAIRALGNSIPSLEIPELRLLLGHKDATIRFQAATALGRLADAKAVRPLLTALDEPDYFTRFAMFTALNSIGRAHPALWESIARGLTNQNPRIREGISYALRETYDMELVRVLSKVAALKVEIPVRETALRLLSSIAYTLPEWKGEWWAYHPALAPPPTRDTEWAGTKLVLSALHLALDASSGAIRLAAIEGVHVANDRSAAPKLLELFGHETDTRILVAAMKTLARVKDSGLAEKLVRILNQPTSDPTLMREAIEAAAGLRAKETLPALTHLAMVPNAGRTNAIAALGAFGDSTVIPAIASSLKEGDAAARLASIQALGKIKSSSALENLTSAMQSRIATERIAIAHALGNLQMREALPSLLELWKEKETRPVALEALTRFPDLTALDAYLEGLGSRNPTVRDQCRDALRKIRDSVVKLIEPRVASLNASVVGELRFVYDGHTTATNGPIFTSSAKVLSLEDYTTFAMKTPGNPVRGQRLFWDESGVACIRCHAIAGHGATIGPDMTLIGSQFARKDLIEHVLYPSRVVREGYQQVLIETKPGDSFAGIIRAESAETLTLVDAQGKPNAIPKSTISKRTNSALSLMPEGLHAGLSLEQFADLIAFLESRKSDPRKVETRKVPEGFTSMLGGVDQDRPLGWRELPPGTQRVDTKAIQRGRSAEHWTLKDGVLEHDGLTGDLWSEREFADFDLSFEWRWADAPKFEDFPLFNSDGLEAGPDGRAATERVLDAGDSGLLMRGLYKAQANLFCYPVGSGEFWEYRTDPNSTPAQRRAFTPSKNADRPIGDWNEMRIQLRGDRVTISVNGEEVISNAELPGLPSRGPIGLQHEHGRIQFRSLFVRELP